MVLLYDGIIESFEQYEGLNNKLDIVLKAKSQLTQNINEYNPHLIEEELSKAFDKKHYFEDQFEGELNSFDKTYKLLLTMCINSLLEIIKARDNSVISN